MYPVTVGPLRCSLILDLSFRCQKFFDFYTQLKDFGSLALFYSLHSKYSSYLRVYQPKELGPGCLCFQLTGYQIIKPDAIFKLEQEEPWIIDEQVLSQSFSGERSSGAYSVS